LAQTLVEVTGYTLFGWDDNIVVHKDLLCYYSPIFRRKLTESGGSKIKLQSASKTTFKLFQFWLYAQATREEEAPSPKRIRSFDNQMNKSSKTALRDSVRLAPDWLKGFSQSHYQIAMCSWLNNIDVESPQTLFSTVFFDLYEFSEQYWIVQLEQI
jgi:hypothetical protein